MKVLAIHNYYQQRGGEDQCFEDEVVVLREHGHEVIVHTVHNDEIHAMSQWRVAAQTIWNRAAYRRVESLIREHRPDVMHAMNTFPRLSFSVLSAARKHRVPILLEVQNYRFACAGAYLLRDGKICEKCLTGPTTLPAIIHRCYRGSLIASAVNASSIGMHRWLKTWSKNVDLFMCPSEVAKSKLVQFGIQPDRVFVKPNMVEPDPGASDSPRTDRVCLFVGRLSPEKGLATLIEAWQSNPQLPTLKIIGDGPEATRVRSAAEQDSRIQWLGRMPLPELLAEVGKAYVLIVPSVWHETFGRTTIEAFAKGTPVIASRMGGMAEVVEEGKTGWLFEPGNSGDLATKLFQALQLGTDEMNEMRQAARAVYRSRYTSQNNYRMLLQALELAIANANQ